MNLNNTFSLYHYCSLETFIKIMQTRTLRLSDVSKSNDAQELIWYQKCCTDFIKEKWDAFLTAKKIDRKTLDRYNKIVSLAESLAVNHPKYVWTMCFSEKKDDLDQWRGYGDDAKGISIGFDREKLEMFNYSAVSINNLYFKGLHRVSYAKKEVQKRLDYLWDYELHLLSSDPSELLKRMEGIIKTAPDEAMLFKNYSFRGEKEWRVIVLGTKNTSFSVKDLKINDLLTIKDTGFYEKRGFLNSYIDIYINDLSSIINEIIIGSKANVSEQDVESMLYCCGILKNNDTSIVIRKSGSTYR